MHRFYVEDYFLENDNYHHAINVLRLKTGDEIEVIQGLGRRFLAKIDSIDSEARVVGLEVISRVELSVELPKKLILVQCVTRPDKLSGIVETCTQLGVSEIQLAESSRIQHKMRGERLNRKLEHLKKVAESSAGLSGREIIPKIAPPLPFDEAILASSGEKLIPWELERDNYISSTLAGDQETITVVIGPEGGLAHDEIAFALKNGFKPITLGPRILRTQLASIVTFSQILALIEGKK